MKAVSEWNATRVGWITIAVGLALGLGTVLLSVSSFGTTSYTAVVEHTAGLRTGENVEVHGVQVGKVTGIELDEDQVVVEFVVDSDISLGSRTTATVKVATLLGSHYLEVDPQGSGELADGRIPLERTAVPYNLQDVLEQGAGALEELDPEVLAEALTAVAGTLGASKQEIGPALEGVARLSEVVATRSDQAGELLTSARSVTDQLSESSEDLVTLMGQTNLVVSEVTARRDAIHRLLVETAELSDALSAIVASTEGRLGPALRDVNDVLDFLNNQDEKLTRVLDVMAPAVRYVANATGNGPWLDLLVNEPAIPADDTVCGVRGGCGR